MTSSSGIRHFANHADYLNRKPLEEKLPETPESKKAPKQNQEPAKAKTPPKEQVDISDEAEGRKKADTNKSSTSKSPPVPLGMIASEIPELALKAISQTQGSEAVEEVENPRDPSLYFLSGFRLFGLSSSNGDGIREMATHKEGAEHYSWADEKAVFEKIIEKDDDAPLVLVGHSLGANAAVRIARQLNTAEHDFKKVDLLVTMDAFGLNNDVIPTNVKENLNFIGHRNIILNDGPNIARDTSKTKVMNELRDELHTKIDNAPDVQSQIYSKIEGVLSRAKDQIDNSSNPWRFESLVASDQLSDTAPEIVK